MKKPSFKSAHLLALAFSFGLMAQSLQIFPAMAEDPGQVKASVAQTAAAQIDQPKLEIAKRLTTWLQNTLQEKKALVAVVARKGGDDVKKHDATGMAHSGIAVYDPRAKTWIVYNLLNDNKEPTNPVSDIWRTSPLDFFYGQTGYEKDALLLIPDTETQKRIYEAVLNGNYKKLLFTRNYNLLSTYDSDASLNCNKWILLNLTAARIDNYNPPSVLSMIHQGFEPGVIKLNPIEKAVVSKKHNIRASELPQRGPIQTVTIESFYRSNLFTDKLFYSGKSI